MMNCTLATANLGWIQAGICQRLIVGFLGSVGNIISLWCVVQCGKTNRSTRFHLIFLFSVMLAITLVALPALAFIDYITSFCKFLWFPEALIVTISMSGSFLFQLERTNFAAIAVIRCLAVWHPLFFQKFSKIAVVVVMEVVLCLYALLHWIVGFSLGSGKITYSRKYWMVMFGKDDALEEFLFTWLGVNYWLTFLVTLLAYLLMIVKIIHRRRVLGVNQKTATTMDNVSFTIHMVLLTNLLLDGPHVLVHMITKTGLASLIIHMVFFLHLVIDPVVFVGLNQHYRRALHRRLHTCLPSPFSTYLGNPTTSDSTPRTPDTALQGSSREADDIQTKDLRL